MIDTRAINLRDLHRQLFVGRAAERGMAHLAEARAGGNLNRLLRYHAPLAVEGEEIEKREDVDAFLTYCGTLEIAALAGFVATPPDAPWIPGIRRELEDDTVERFFTVHYPLRLPPLFRERLRGHWSAVEDDVRLASELFIRFLAISEAVEADPDVLIFRRMLDDFEIGGHRDRDLRRAVGDVARFIELLSAVDPADALAAACRGLVRFSGFARQLHELLLSAESLPRLRAAMWCQHSYWFIELKEDLGTVIQGLARSALEVVEAEGAHPDESDRLRSHLEEMAVALTTLMDADYGNALPQP